MTIKNDPNSLWGQRLWIDDEEFDLIMDKIRQKIALDVFEDEKGIDIEAILERVYKVIPDYVELDESILGKTIFYHDRIPEIHINRSLSDAAESGVAARHRFRSTLAHECAHIALHRQLNFKDSTTLSLFLEMPAATPVLCRRQSRTTLSHSNQKEWWEYQANRGMASLLLPKELLKENINNIVSSCEFVTIIDALAACEVEKTIKRVMRIFDVSMPLAMFRLQELGYIPKNAKQQPLFLE